MRALQPVIPCRTTLEVIIPSKDGLSPEQWKETALCPLDRPSNYSLLRLWHMQGSLQKTENDLRLQTGHSHMFTSWTVHHHLFAERVLFRRPPIFEAASVLQDHIRNGVFPNRRLRQRPQAPALEAHQAALDQLRQNAEAHQRTHPVNFELTNEWTATITADKRHHRDYQLQGLTGWPITTSPPFLSFLSLYFSTVHALFHPFGIIVSLPWPAPGETGASV